MESLSPDSIRIPEDIIKQLAEYCTEHELSLSVLSTPNIGFVLLSASGFSGEMVHVGAAELLLNMITTGKLQQAQAESEMSKTNPKGLM